MQLKLNGIIIENFKGLKKFQADFNGENATITAANGIGKTTVYDALLWLFFGKDSTGRKDFQVRPLDENNKPIPGLTLSVQAEIDVDGSCHILRKDHEEKITKGQFRGYESTCYIDEVPKKLNEFQAFIDELIPEDTFKMLTNLRHFNELHWTDRRKVLFDIAGKIGNPKGFDMLIMQLNGRSIEDYKKVLAGQKSQLEKDLSEINPRIDELQRGIDGYAGQDLSKVEQSRTCLKADLAELDKRRTNILNTERARQKKIDNLNTLKTKQAARERELVNDTSGVSHLLEEKATIEQGVSIKQQAVVNARSAVGLKMQEIKYEQARLNQNTAALNDVRQEYKTASAVNCESKCYACGQDLPADKLEENEKKKTAKLQEVIRKGDGIKALVDECNKKIEQLQTELAGLNQTVKHAEIELNESEEYKAKRTAEITELMGHKKTTPAEHDPIWKDLGKQIAALENEIGEPASEQLQAIESDRHAKQQEIEELGKTLAQADRIKQDTARIEELGRQEQALAQQIADIEKQIAEIGRYVAAESDLIEAAVNGKFKLVKFKLFNRLINGGIEDCCESTLDGVPYSDCSYGQKAIMGIDIINTLSEHYGVSVPLVIDNAESITFPIEYTGQTIRLVAQKGVKKLTIKTEKEI